ncbi:hypothetical protein HK101_009868 [Irineochytrium annulatum]|nr:hypothetical protein HK101_009868 [Irineochytrium annulatum]
MSINELPLELLHLLAAYLHPNEAVSLPYLSRDSRARFGFVRSDQLFARTNLGNLVASARTPTTATTTTTTAVSVESTSAGAASAPTTTPPSPAEGEINPSTPDLPPILSSVDWSNLPQTYWLALLSLAGGFTLAACNLLSPGWRRCRTHEEWDTEGVNWVTFPGQTDPKAATPTNVLNLNRMKHTMRRALEAGAVEDVTSDHYFALYWSAAVGDVDIMAPLISTGSFAVDVLQNAFYDSVEHNRPNVMRLLLSHGASPTAMENMPFIEASVLGHLSALTLLLDTVCETGGKWQLDKEGLGAIADLSLRYSAGDNRVELVEHVLGRAWHTGAGLTGSFTLAVERGHTKTVEKLLTYRPISGYVRLEESVVREACLTASEEGYVAVLRILMEWLGQHAAFASVGDDQTRVRELRELRSSCAMLAGSAAALEFLMESGRSGAWCGIDIGPLDVDTELMEILRSTSSGGIAKLLLEKLRGHPSLAVSEVEDIMVGAATDGMVDVVRAFIEAGLMRDGFRDMLAEILRLNGPAVILELLDEMAVAAAPPAPQSVSM